jgi:hypothetical protein
MMMRSGMIRAARSAAKKQMKLQQKQQAAQSSTQTPVVLTEIQNEDVNRSKRSFGTKSTRDNRFRCRLPVLQEDPCEVEWQ